MKAFVALFYSLLLLGGAVSSVAQTCSPSDREAWFSSAVQEMGTVAVGSTREDFTKVFTRGPGLSSLSRLSGSYVYKGSPYIRVDVEFSPDPDEQDPNVESPKDTVKKISKPYLAQPTYD